jgi:glycerol-3-phosphate dehydrogenase
MSEHRDGATVAVLGCGNMGSAVAQAISRYRNVMVWNRSRQRAEAMRRLHEHSV